MWTAPRTWVAGEVVTAAIMNTHIRDNQKALSDAWASYSPTWTASTTNPTLGNGGLIGTYLNAGKLVMYRIRVAFGSTTTVGSGTYTWTLPVAAITTSVPVGMAVCFDASAVTNNTRQAFSTASGISLQSEAGAAVTHASPFAWATGDLITITGTYEAA